MNKELNLERLDEYENEELIYFVKLLADKLERRTNELEMLKARVSGRIGYGATKNPNVR